MSIDQWSQWAAARPAGRVLHLDTAAAGRQSSATLEATAAHARLEADTGAYVAQELAAPVLDALRDDIARLVGVAADGVAFVESASAGRAALLASWPLPEDATIGVLPVEWGPNLEAFTRRGLRVTELDADGVGRLDLDALRRRLDRDPPTVVHLTQVTSHRGLVQPVAQAVAVCRAAGVPIWVDAAQALGQLDTATGADAVYATSRKWLAGPRGVGVLAVDERHWSALDAPVPAMAPDQPPVARLESHEAHVAGRVGLATAVREYLAAGPAQLHRRLDEVGRQTREAVASVRGWAVVGAGDATGAITALRPTGGQDPVATRARLLGEHGVLTTAGSPARAPRDGFGPLLRISPHVDCTPADLERLCVALHG